jgi:hypothetical protein
VDATDNEVTYTHGEYLAPEGVKEAFKLKEPPPAPHGIAPNQPNPHKAGLVSTFAWTGIWLVGLLVLSGFFAMRSANRTVLEQAVVVPADAQPGTPSAMNFSEPFELSKRGNMKVELSAGLDNEWLGIQGDLVNQDTGAVVGFSEELSYYHGRDDEGSWSEGNSTASATLSALPAGKYVLRTTAAYDATSQGKPRTFNVKLTHDTPNGSWFCCALVLLLLGPAWALYRSHGFETQRWAESNLTES